MKTPPHLKAGDKVGIVSTAKRTSPEEIEPGLEILRSWGLEPVLGRHVFSQHGFFAGTDEERAEDLQAMIDDDEIKAIFFSKGAYGTLRMSDLVVYSNLVERPKWIAGYSDITALHQVINSELESIHSVMLQGMASATPAALESLRAALFGEPLSYTIPWHERNLRREAVRGRLCGGNLSLLYALLDGESTAHGDILFFEDIDEYLYHFDRILVTLKSRGVLARLKAILVGALTDIKESTIPFGQDAYDIVLQHTAEYGYPVYFGFPAGHIADNRALILGREISITPEADELKIAF